MKRQLMAEKMAGYCDAIKELFAYKNKDYGTGDDAFGNFRKTAQRLVVPFLKSKGVEIDEFDAMFLTLLIYQDKHLVALSHSGLNGAEVDERLGDIANYALIGRAMLTAKQEQEKKTKTTIPDREKGCRNCRWDTPNSGDCIAPNRDLSKGKLCFVPNCSDNPLPYPSLWEPKE